MGGAVSSGHDNDDLINNLKAAGYIKTPDVERVFRIVDRAHYYLADCRDSAYKDLAWKNGTLHLSAPCIYSEVMEALELKKGLSFLNLGSGTGYLNTMVGFMIGPFGINHGIELHAENVEYANKKLESFIHTSKKFDDLELCEPQFVVGNCLNLAPENHLYDRVYCGASCPPEQKETIQNMIKINGILVIPVGDQLLKIKRINATEFTTDNVLPVSFASLVLPVPAGSNNSIILMPEVNPLSLQFLCRITIRNAIRDTFDFSLPTVNEAASNINKIKHIKATKFFRSEVGRHPLNILPTAQGLMLLAAFDSSNEDDDDDDENSRGPSVNLVPCLNRQLRRQAFEFHAREKSKNGTEDVDSDLSDMEDEGIQVSHQEDVNGNRQSSFLSNSMNCHEKNIEDDEDKGVEQMSLNSISEQDGEGVVQNEHFARSAVGNYSDGDDSPNETVRENTIRSTPYVKIADRYLTIMSPRTINMSSYQSDDNIASSVHETSSILLQPEADFDLASRLSSRSPAIQVTPSMGVPIKESYSTSAETCGTSGFGSLVDDNSHLSSQQSRLESLKDDMETMPEDDCLPVSSSAQNNKRSPQSKSSIGESSVDCDSFLTDSADTAWIDTDGDDDDDDDENTSLGNYKFKKMKSFGEHKVSNTKDNNNDDLSHVKYNDNDNGPNFHAFLKAQVETLPLPSSLKAFILYYRQGDQDDSVNC